mmetsp:Transcript_25042/g.35046  ORF Transcript_25042/g.35046 Transcript_25042/m.35046 type:complete len:191 (-) Transcript_25042:1143-1715(-)
MDEEIGFSVGLVFLISCGTLFNKRRMARGGSELSKSLKEQALKRKQTNRRRLRDMVNDPLLSRQMERSLENSNKINNTGQGGGGSPTVTVSERMEQIRQKASQPVTHDDVYISADDISSAAIIRTWFILLVIFGVVAIFWGEHTIFIWVALVIVELLDDMIFFSRRKITGICRQPNHNNGYEEDDSAYTV